MIEERIKITLPIEESLEAVEKSDLTDELKKEIRGSIIDALEKTDFTTKSIMIGNLIVDITISNDYQYISSKKTGKNKYKDYLPAYIEVNVMSINTWTGERLDVFSVNKGIKKMFSERLQDMEV